MRLRADRLAAPAILAHKAHMPTLMLHDSARRTKLPFMPEDPGHVRLYVCGPTVYDRAHLGNARPVVVFDVLARLLRRLYPRVTYVRNVTDVDDKINARSAETGEPIGEITARTLAWFHADMAALGALPPDVEPRATAHVPEMLELIGRLIAGGHAYAAAGHVLFRTASFAQYGALSGRDPEELLAGARVEVAPYKQDPRDFVLWKPSDAGLPGWDSPWGRGRPGWHIECSAMAWRYLGESFDIHGGGADLLFPHHENECAQSLCAFPGSRFARHWMHNGMVLVGGEKMSKSLGNFTTVTELLADWPGEAVRLFLLRAGYRAPVDLTPTALRDAKGELDRFYRAAGDAAPAAEPPAAVLEALCDDLNTPAALAAMHGLADAALAGNAVAAAELRTAGGMLGILGQGTEAWFRTGADAAWVEGRIAARRAARAARDFAAADAVRAELLECGIVLEDSARGTTWRRA